MARYKITIEYDIEFGTPPPDLAQAIEDALQIADTESVPRLVESATWDALITLKSKTIEEV